MKLMSTFSMRAETTGKGDFVVLVLGGLTGWLTMIPHAEQLAKNYRVVRVQPLNVDLGIRNEPLPEDYSVDYETKALAQTVEQNNILQAHYLGWSYGGEIALNYALDNPEKVRTLTLIEPAAFWVLRSVGKSIKELADEQKKFQSLDSDDVTEAQLEWFAHAVGLVPPDVDPKELPVWPSWVKHRQSQRMGDTPFRHEDSMERVRSFNKPVLLFKGEGSSKLQMEIIDVLGENFPDAQVYTLPGGHALPVVSMDNFMKILTSFLDSSK